MSYKPLSSLEGHTAVITGFRGAIGFATANRLAARGCRIIGLVRSEVEDVQAKIKLLPNSELEHYAILTDVTDTAQMNNAVKQIAACDILVNASGTTLHIPHSDTDLLSDKFFDKMITDNLRSYYTVIRTLLPMLKNSSNGLIVNIGSSVGAGVGGSNIAYACAKAGVDSLTRNLSKVIAPVRIITISPGGVDTDFIKNRPEGYYEKLIPRTPLGRVATPNDVAAAVEAYATLVRFVTGEVITIDGGWTV